MSDNILKSFRLLEIQFERHEILNDLKLNFVDDTNIDKGPYSTLIIGVNGSGKSHVLKAIIQVFRELENIHKHGRLMNLFRGGFRIAYKLDGALYEIDTIKKKQVDGKIIQRNYLRSGEPIASGELQLPGSIIANSIMLNDRFPVIKDKESDIYFYQGIRRTPSIAGTKSHLKKTLFGILGKLSEIDFLDHIRDILGFLGYEEKIELSFYPRYKRKFFTNNLTIEMFHQIFKDWEKSPDRTTLPYSLSAYHKIRNDSNLIEGIVGLLNKTTPLLRKLYSGSRATYFVYDIFSNELNAEEIKLLETLHTLDIFSEPSISLKKKGAEFTFGDSSSGEYHILASMIGILTRLQSQSLVLIDEPEISLHPSWQMRYVDFLKKTFKSYPDCHFIIGTHSHFLVSDLVKDTSALIHMTIEDRIKGALVPWSTFGWSAEQVLLDVFQVPTTRNYFVADRVGAILDLIAKPKRDEEEIRTKVQELRKHNLEELPSDDPLKDVVLKLLNKYAS